MRVVAVQVVLVQVVLVVRVAAVDGVLESLGVLVEVGGVGQVGPRPSGRADGTLTVVCGHVGTVRRGAVR
jgi:hypothetical protein